VTGFKRQLSGYDPVVGHRFLPGLKARVDHEGGGYLVRTNQLGFRCEREFDREKSPDSYRILLFGDSFTAGTGVSNRKRYSDILETLLPGVEVFNFGMPGTGLDQQYLIFQQYARDIEHDLVVIAPWVENIIRTAARFRQVLGSDGEVLCVAKPYFVLGEDGRLEARNIPVPRARVDAAALAPEDRRHLPPHLRVTEGQAARARVLRAVGSRASRRAHRLVRGMSRFDPVPGYRASHGPQWRLFKAILTQWIREAGSEVVLMPIPMPAHVEERAPARYYRRRFAELHDPPRVRVHDVLTDVSHFSLAERRAFRFAHSDQHPTPEYHRVLAESLARTVSEAMEAMTRSGWATETLLTQFRPA
jgi:carbamoyltransferase